MAWDANCWKSRWPIGLMPRIPPLGPGHAGHVYVIGFADYVKIGWSRDVEARLLDIQSMLPEDLRIYGLIAGTRDTEVEVHDMFGSLRLQREWFRLDDHLRDWIVDGCLFEESQNESQGRVAADATGRK